MVENAVIYGSERNDEGNFTLRLMIYTSPLAGLVNYYSHSKGVISPQEREWEGQDMELVLSALTAFEVNKQHLLTHRYIAECIGLMFFPRKQSRFSA